MRIDSSLITPIYVKEHDGMPPPPDQVYYLLSANNLYLCRKDQFFDSCAPAPQWPTELAPHAASLTLKCPPIEKEMFETICGFFGHMSQECGAEAIVLLAWDEQEQRVRTIVPPQVSAVSNATWGSPFPIGVKYQFPRNLPRHWKVFCDIHSHCDMAAYASQTDVEDEETFAGLHIVVGRLHLEPPDFHVEGVVDGHRFPFKIEDVVEGYQQRRAFPSEWVDQVVVTNYSAYRAFDFEQQHPSVAKDAPPQSASDNSPDSQEETTSHDENGSKQPTAQGQTTDADPRP